MLNLVTSLNLVQDIRLNFKKNTKWVLMIIYILCKDLAKALLKLVPALISRFIYFLNLFFF
ncbi:hypothetical protein [uncultured Gammaproteobacteria bacterium]|nr:hypothetical protein [uncultured Gammaproteobacteria bacterium]CAC9570666.1 hypothetical protein [uncultured Gammaproteobacteria bacterium]